MRTNEFSLLHRKEMRAQFVLVSLLFSGGKMRWNSHHRDEEEVARKENIEFNVKEMRSPNAEHMLHKNYMDRICDRLYSE